MNLWPDVPQALLIIAVVLAGLWVSNYLYDKGWPNYRSRKAAHIGGGLAFLLSGLLFPSPWVPLALAFGFLALLGGARVLRPQTFRGTGGSGRSHALAEVNFPLGGGVALLGWAVTGNPMVGVLPGAMLGFGDAITGAVRWMVYHKEVKGLWGSVAMLGVCIALAFFMTPAWIGITGALAATLAEKWTPTTKLTDDNLTVPLAAGAVMTVLYLGWG